MRLLVVIALILSSCTAQWHVKRALKKDPTLQDPTEYIDTISFTRTVVDTIHTSDSTFYIETREIHYDTIISFQYQKYDFSGLESWFQTWQKEKTNRVEIRNERKENETRIKQENRTQRTEIRNERKIEKLKGRWWGWMLLGAFGVLLMFLILWIRKEMRLDK